MSKRDELILDLITALFTVNRMSLEAAVALGPGLEREGLSHPPHVITMAPNDVAVRLRAAGFSRGEYMSQLMAVRLLALSKAIEI